MISFVTALRTGADALRANPVRAVLATLGVVIGSAALAAVFAVGDGVEAYLRRQVSDRGYDVVMLRAVTEDSVDGQWVARPETAPLGVAEVSRLARALVPGERAMLSQRGAVLTTLRGDARTRALAVHAVALWQPDTLGAPPLAGRRLLPEETRSGAAVAVIDTALARALAGAPEATAAARAVGDSLRLADRWVRVVGVVAPEEGRGARGALSLTAPFAVAAPALVPSRNGASPIVLVTARRAEEVQALRDRVQAWVRAGEPRWRDGYRVRASAEWQLLEIRRAMMVFRILMGSFAGITLVVGGIGIMNVLLASVAERTREIGIRKAMGARRRDILLQFLSESVAITASGGAIGTALGIGGAYAVTALMRAQTGARIYAATTVPTLLFSAGVAVMVGLAFGCYPALRAARLLPIEAIHTE